MVLEALLGFGVCSFWASGCLDVSTLEVLLKIHFFGSGLLGLEGFRVWWVCGFRVQG